VGEGVFRASEPREGEGKKNKTGWRTLALGGVVGNQGKKSERRQRKGKRKEGMGKRAEKDRTSPQ
jgi:hypothetical protein